MVRRERDMIARGHVGHFREVGAGDEIATSPGQHDDPDIGVGAKSGHLVGYPRLYLQIECIASLRPVDGEDGDTVFLASAMHHALCRFICGHDNARWTFVVMAAL